MKVLITGANGFVGSAVVRHLVAAGHTVLACGRTPPLPMAAAMSFVRWQLGDPLPTDATSGCDAVVHGAYDPRPDQAAANRRGTQLAIQSASSAGVRRQLLLSSFSAHPEAASSYGRGKYELEQVCEAVGGTIVRPGLVVGPGGLFGRMIATVRRLPLVPLPDGGRRPVPLLGVTDLATCLERIVVAPSPQRAWNLCYAERPSLRVLLRGIAAALQRTRWWMPLPSGLLTPPLRMLGALHPRFAAAAESLRAYRSNAEYQHPSDYPVFGLPERALDDLLRDAVASPPPSHPCQS